MTTTKWQTRRCDWCREIIHASEEFCGCEAETEILRLRAALQSDGVLVPREPTQEMAAVFTKAYIGGAMFKDAYREMLQIAPSQRAACAEDGSRDSSNSAQVASPAAVHQQGESALTDENPKVRPEYAEGDIDADSLLPASPPNAAQEKCPNGLLPDGPVCPRCGLPRGPSGVDGGSWVHLQPQQPPSRKSAPSDAAQAGPVAWILTSPHGRVIHASKRDGWTVEVVLTDPAQPSQHTGGLEADECRTDEQVGREWRTDSSLEKWFPLSADELTNLKADGKNLRSAIEALNERIRLLRETSKAQGIKRAEAEQRASRMLTALDAAETMLRCLPETTTNANGTKPTMTTISALRLVRAALSGTGPLPSSGFEAGVREAARICKDVAGKPSSLWEEKGCWSHAAENCAIHILALLPSEPAEGQQP